MSAQSISPSVDVSGKLTMVNGEFVMLLAIGGTERLFVASASRRGRWYEIIDNKCCCEAAEHSVECHHLKQLRSAAASLQEKISS